MIKNFGPEIRVGPLLNRTPVSKSISKSINYIHLVETNDYEDHNVNLIDSNIFNLLIFENTKIETQIYSKMSLVILISPKYTL